MTLHQKKDKDDSGPEIALVVIDLALTFMKRIADLLHLAALEAELALKTLIIIALLIFILGSLVTALWISLQVMLFFYLLSLQWSTLMASTAIVMINLFSVSLILFILYKVKDNLLFRNTRNQLNPTTANSSDVHHARISTKN